MIRIKLTIAYDGTDFCGWQYQPRDRTVQGELEKALAVILGKSPRVHGSGRTDAGVHAIGQVAHFDCEDDRSGIKWQRGLNSLLPADVKVVDCSIIPADFHARYSALSKTYEYTLWHKREFCLPQRSRFVWSCGPVDSGLMEDGAAILTGEHDFAAFQNAGTEIKTTVRTISDISQHPGSTKFETIWRFSASGFLKQMVRNLMGCLVACGKGKISPEEIRSILISADRTLAPKTAPAHGLTLLNVEYPSYGSTA